MDSVLARVKSASLMSVAMTVLFEATERAREGGRFELATELEHLCEELVYLHRKVLDLPPEATPAACEFERADLNQDDAPF